MCLVLFVGITKSDAEAQKLPPSGDEISKWPETTCARDEQLKANFAAAAVCERQVFERIKLYLPEVAPGSVLRSVAASSESNLAYDLLMQGDTKQATAVFDQGLSYRNDRYLHDADELFVEGHTEESFRSISKIFEPGLSEIPMRYRDSGKAKLAENAIHDWLAGRKSAGVRELGNLVDGNGDFDYASLVYAEMLFVRGSRDSACKRWIMTAQHLDPGGRPFMGASFVAMQMLSLCQNVYRLPK